MPLIILLVVITDFMCTNRYLYLQMVLQKCGRGQQFLFGLRLVSRIFEENQQSAIQTNIEHHFGGFFQQIKGQQPIGREVSKQTVTPTSRRLD
jgi:hypothetical protein